MLVPVILSGGAGTRLWPLSRELYPKQLLPLMGRHTMLQDTALRLSGMDVTPPVVVLALASAPEANATPGWTLSLARSPSRIGRSSPALAFSSVTSLNPQPETAV